MEKDKKNKETQDNLENLNSAVQDGQQSAPNDKANGTSQNGSDKPENNEFEIIKAQLDNKSRQCEEFFDMLQRTAAEFDNYKKRTAREKEALYSEAVSDAVAAFLPVVDSIERAIQACSKESGEQSIKEGVELVNRQIKDVMKRLGVEEIKCVGEEFNPELHNAVMHIDDDSYGHNVIVEEFQKGYKFKDRVIRHSMVKVAN